jgi:hypothetical protein
MPEGHEDWHTDDVPQQPTEEHDISYMVGLRHTAFREARDTLFSFANFVIVSAAEPTRRRSTKPVDVVLNLITRPVKPKHATGFVALKSRMTDQNPLIIDAVVTRTDSPRHLHNPVSTLASLYPYEMRGHSYSGQKELAFINLLRGMSRAIRTKSQPPALVPNRRLPARIAAADNGKGAEKSLIPGMVIDLSEPASALQYLKLTPNPAARGQL